MKVNEPFKACVQCTRLLPVSATSCEHCGTPIVNLQERVVSPGAMDIAATPEPSCTEMLEYARDSADAMLGELKQANATCCSGMASLLLLDMIENATVMAARIRAIIEAAKENQS